MSGEDINLTAEEFRRFHEQLPELVRTSVPRGCSLSELAYATLEDDAQAAAEAIAGELERGLPLDKALELHGHGLPDVYVALLRAGGQAGSFDMVAEALVAESRGQRLSIAAALLALVLVVATIPLIVVAMYIPLWYVVPRYVAIFQSMGMALPTATVAIITIAMVLHHNIIVVLAALGFVTVLVLAIVACGAAVAPGGLLLNFPILGRSVRGGIAASFAATTGVLLRLGVAMEKALVLAQSVARSAHAQQFIADVRDGVGDGRPLSEMLERHAFFKPAAIQAIREAEGGKDLDNTLLRLADSHNWNEQKRLVRFTWRLYLLEIVLGLLLVAVVWFAVVYLPHAQLQETLK